ncbi:MAG: precorrin-6y C5,15-methyltransferase (decarboxylating) subunit CbiE [Flavobacteriales bacterium]
MPNIDYILIGLSDTTKPQFSSEIQEHIKNNKNFSGGERHFEKVKHLLSKNHQWYNIKGNIKELFNTYKNLPRPIVIFTSGDPYFFGFAQTIKKYEPNASLKVYPYFNSIQLLSHKVGITYQNIDNISLHGRDWNSLDQKLISKKDKIGILTGPDKMPDQIAQRLKEYNFNNYYVYVGEALGNKDKEKTGIYTLNELEKQKFDELNCLILISDNDQNLDPQIDNEKIQKITQKPGMITKQSIRSLTISKSELYKAKEFWDIGYCTGSIAIEAKTKFPHLNVTGFEKRKECYEILENNAKKLSVPGIDNINKDFMEYDISGMNEPDTVFIGGHGGKLEEMLKKVDKYLNKGGVIIMNCIKNESKQTFEKTLKNLGYHLKSPIEVKEENSNTISIVKGIKLQKEKSI